MFDLSPLSEKGAEARRPVAPDALAALRAATATRHQHLDSSLALAREDANLADYAQHIAVIGDWLVDLDIMTGGANLPTSWQESQTARHSRIAQDLVDCQRAHPALAPQTLHRPAAAADHGFAWGIAYVVEGSQLGGQMLHRRLHARLAPHPLRYLRDGNQAGHWPRFTAALRAAVDTPEAIRAACEGAVLAFDMLSDRFARVEVQA